MRKRGLLWEPSFSLQNPLPDGSGRIGELLLWAIQQDQLSADGQRGGHHRQRGQADAALSGGEHLLHPGRGKDPGAAQ